MGWNCKPSGPYNISDPDGTENCQLYYQTLSQFTNDDNIVGQLCNVVAESGLNPWRWQGDVYGTGRGYGLFQFTPASGYLALTSVPGYGPNLSTTQVSGGLPSDADAQLTVFINDLLSKWVSTCWRSYWDPATYPSLYAKRAAILATYGSGTSLSFNQFLAIDNTEDACFAFLACYEGPLVPNLTARLSNEEAIRNALALPPPGPTPGTDDDFLILMVETILLKNRGRGNM